MRLHMYFLPNHVYRRSIDMEFYIPLPVYRGEELVSGNRYYRESTGNNALGRGVTRHGPLDLSLHGLWVYTRWTHGPFAINLTRTHARHVWRNEKKTTAFWGIETRIEERVRHDIICDDDCKQNEDWNENHCKMSTWKIHSKMRITDSMINNIFIKYIKQNLHEILSKQHFHKIYEAKYTRDTIRLNVIKLYMPLN